MSSERKTANATRLVSLADEEGVKEILAATVLDLWKVVNNLTREGCTKSDPRFRGPGVQIRASMEERACPYPFGVSSVGDSSAYRIWSGFHPHAVASHLERFFVPVARVQPCWDLVFGKELLICG